MIGGIGNVLPILAHALDRAGRAVPALLPRGGIALPILGRGALPGTLSGGVFRRDPAELSGHHLLAVGERAVAELLPGAVEVVPAAMKRGSRNGEECCAIDRVLSNIKSDVSESEVISLSLPFRAINGADLTSDTAEQCAMCIL